MSEYLGENIVFKFVCKQYTNYTICNLLFTYTVTVTTHRHDLRGKVCRKDMSSLDAVSQSQLLFTARIPTFTDLRAVIMQNKPFTLNIMFLVRCVCPHSNTLSGACFVFCGPLHV